LVTAQVTQPLAPYRASVRVQRAMIGKSERDRLTLTRPLPA